MADEPITIGADYTFDHPCIVVVRAGQRVINCIRLYPESYEHFKCEVAQLAAVATETDIMNLIGTKNVTANN